MTSTTTNARRVDLTITVLNAVNLPKVRVWTPKCSVSITVGVETQVTKRVQGHSPVWNETLSFTQVSTSDVKIQILHGKASPKVIAEAVTSIRSEHLNGKIDEPLKLRLLVSTMAQREAPIIFLSMTSAIPRDHITTTAGTVVVESNLKTLKAVAVTESSTPVPTTELKFSNVLEYIKPFIDIGAAIAELNPYTKLAWALLTVGFKILDALYTRNAQVRDLWKIILECLDFMEQAEPLKAIQNLSGTAQAIIVQLQESVKFLTDYGKKTMTETIFQTLFPGDIDTKIKEFSDNFSQLKTQFDQRVNLDQWKVIQANGEKITIVSTKIDKLLRKSEDQDLRSLPGANLGGIQWGSICHPGTRTKLVSQILAWAVSDSSASLLWLSGAAGTGKSSIAATIGEQLDSMNVLGAFFRFRRDTASDDTPGHLFGSIACQLAFFSEEIRKHILIAIATKSINLTMLQRQAHELVVHPLCQSAIHHPFVIIIDALDEAASDFNKNGKPGREALVRAILEEFKYLPHDVKVFITSRKEGSIARLLPRYHSLKEIDITNIEDTQADISRYIAFRLQKIQDENALPTEWPTDTDIHQLALYADNLFVWANVACSFIEEGPDPQIKLKQILAGKNMVKKGDLDLLYTQVVENSLPKHFTETDLQNWHYIVGSIACFQKPLTIEVMDALLGLDLDAAEKNLPNGQIVYLSSAKYITSRILPLLMEQNGVIQLLHKSVFDFLTREGGDFQIDLSFQNSVLALKSFEKINTTLKYNILQVQNTTFLNSEINDMPERIEKNISAALQYACSYFSMHLLKSSVKYQAKLEAHLTHFFNNNVLHWIEAMSWLGKIYQAEEALLNILDFLKDSDNNNLISIVKDCTLLLQSANQPISSGALQIYHSGLSLCPQNSLLKQTWASRVEYIEVIQTHSAWTAALRIMEGHSNNITSIIFSPDGTKLASSSKDSTVRLWEVNTGLQIGNALLGHTLEVFCVIFSPSGTQLASASWDGTINIWDVQTGSRIENIPKLHKHAVKSIVFSPDGTQLASASWDHTLRLWDAQKGLPIGGSFKGHLSNVNSVAFSPDGMSLASGSDDKNVIIWNSQTGSQIGEAIKGHTYAVTVVIFSPNGYKLASASRDRTVRLWNPETRDSIILEGHTGEISSIDFASDSCKIASASWDKTVRIWDTQTGDLIGNFFEGHTGAVNSVVFSPDGSKLASASDDKTVILWDVHSNNSKGTIYRGHTGAVKHVAFAPGGVNFASASVDNTIHLWDGQKASVIPSTISHTHEIKSLVLSPDGTKLASSSEDMKIMIWDVQTGKLIGDSLCGHTNTVVSVIFSPDGQKLASASHDKTIKLWDVQTGIEINTLHGHDNYITCVIFSPDGTKLASGSYDYTVHLWDLATGIGSALKGHSFWVNSVAFSPDGTKLASGAQDGTVRLWDAQRGISIGSAMYGESSVVNCVAFSPDGTMLASTSSEIGIHLWDVNSGTLIGHTGAIITSGLDANSYQMEIVEFSSDGSKIASISNLNEILIWDVSTLSPCTRQYESFPKYYHFLDASHFLCSQQLDRIIWIPSHLCGRVLTTPDGTVVIYGFLGSMTFVKPKNAEKEVL